MTPMTILFIVFLGTGALFVGLSVPLLLRRVPPNLWYGIRTRETVTNSDIWYEANAYGGWRMLWVGIAIIIAAVAIYLIAGITTLAYALINLGVTMAGTVYLVIACVSYLARIEPVDPASDPNHEG